MDTWIGSAPLEEAFLPLNSIAVAKNARVADVWVVDSIKVIRTTVFVGHFKIESWR